jgi:transposase-like protein
MQRSLPNRMSALISGSLSMGNASARYDLGCSRKAASADSRAGQGYFAYHAVPTNRASISAFRRYVIRLWHRTLRRRSQKDRFPWERMPRLAGDWLPQPRNFHPWPHVRFAVKHSRQEPDAYPETCVTWGCVMPLA